MTYKYLRFCVWSGVVFLFIFGIAFVGAGFIPPPSPHLTGQELLAIVEKNRTGFRIGMMVGYIGALLLVPWSVGISYFMARIEGGRFPVMAFVALGAGIASAVVFCLPFVFWSGAYYRLDNNPELVRLLSDMTWLAFVMLYTPFFLQAISMAVVGLSDKSATPTFPRWFCFLSIWVCILAIPGGFAIFFESGPFAWNGLIALWIPVAAFSIFFVALVPLLFKAIRRQELEDAGAST
jgi:hypothetical protein